MLLLRHASFCHAFDILPPPLPLICRHFHFVFIVAIASDFAIAAYFHYASPLRLMPPLRFACLLTTLMPRGDVTRAFQDDFRCRLFVFDADMMMPLRFAAAQHERRR